MSVCWKFGIFNKRFGALEVLRGVDIAVEQGDVVAILGPSGSGKTTLLRCINFLETADSGEMIFDGETVRPGAHFQEGRRSACAKRRPSSFRITTCSRTRPRCRTSPRG